jgi:hypothetical protein
MTWSSQIGSLGKVPGAFGATSCERNRESDSPDRAASTILPMILSMMMSVSGSCATASPSDPHAASNAIPMAGSRLPSNDCFANAFRWASPHPGNRSRAPLLLSRQHEREDHARSRRGLSGSRPSVRTARARAGPSRRQATAAGPGASMLQARRQEDASVAACCVRPHANTSGSTRRPWRGPADSIHPASRFPFRSGHRTAAFLDTSGF